jgi:hypothetical protein
MRASLAGLALAAMPFATQLHAQSPLPASPLRPQYSVVFALSTVRGDHPPHQAIGMARDNHGLEGAIAGGTITGSLVAIFGSSGCEDNCLLKALGGAVIGAVPGAVIGGLIGGSIPKR